MRSIASTARRAVTEATAGEGPSHGAIPAVHGPAATPVSATYTTGEHCGE